MAITAAHILDLTAYQRALAWDGVYSLAATVAGLQWLGIAHGNRDGRAPRGRVDRRRHRRLVGERSRLVLLRDRRRRLGAVSLAGQCRLHPVGAAGRRRPRALHPARREAVVQHPPALRSRHRHRDADGRHRLPGQRRLAPRSRSGSASAPPFIRCSARCSWSSAPIASSPSAGARGRWILVLLLLGVSCIVGADFLYTFATLNPAFDLGSALDPAWAAGFVLISLAAFEHLRIVERRAPPTTEAIVRRVRRLRQVLPAVALIAMAVTVIDDIGDISPEKAFWMLLPAVLLLAISSAGTALWNRSQFLALQNRNAAARAGFASRRSALRRRAGVLAGSYAGDRQDAPDLRRRQRRRERLRAEPQRSARAEHRYPVARPRNRVAGREDHAADGDARRGYARQPPLPRNRPAQVRGAGCRSKAWSSR